MKSCLKMIFLVAFVSAALPPVHAETKTRDIVILHPQDLPPAVRAAGQSMTLHAFNDGKTYLYIEQQQLSRMVILDVTDPAHIRQAGFASLEIPVSFDFAANLGFTDALVCYPGRKGLAVVSFKNPLKPTVMALNVSQGSAEAERVGESALLVSGDELLSCGESARDLSLLDAFNLASSQPLSTVKGVQKTVMLEETGTTFLLGEGGLTVIRQPRVEQDYWLERTYSS